MQVAQTDLAPVAIPVAIRAWAEQRTIFVELYDGRTISFPANRFRRLASANDAQLQEVTIEVNGYALRWESLDEDLTTLGVLTGLFRLYSCLSMARPCLPMTKVQMRATLE